MNEEVMRMIAAVVGVGILAYPFVGPAVSQASALLGRLGAAGGSENRQRVHDVKIVLELSSRFSETGSKEGIDLCQKLIDVIVKQGNK